MAIIISRRSDCQSSEITPYSVFKKRRQWLQTVATAGIFGTIAPPSLAWWWDQDKKDSQAGGTSGTELAKPVSFGNIKRDSPYSIKDKPNNFKEITNYNNYVEFGYDKSQPAQNAAHLPVRPWTLEIDGMVHKPVTLDIDTLLQKFPLEERIYRLRCVEAWSMVIPWVGIPMASVLKLVEPLGSAKYVRFTSFYDSKISSSGAFTSIALPYQEGLRLDEAMHPLALIAVGLYGDLLPRQNGAPVRAIIPWKYGFKGAKSIVRISFTDKQPVTAWNSAQPNEYGFYANVNPTVDHPRWSQAKERRIGGLGTSPTLMFNGYEEQVASLYAGMNLKNYY